MNKALKSMPAHLENVEGIKFGEVDMEYLMLNTPPLCNYECKKCFTKVSSRVPEKTLSLKKMLETIYWGKEKGVKVISILGEGEPLVYQHFKTIVKYINDNGIIPLFVSNGYLLDKDTVDFLYDNNAVIVVSLDTLDEEEYKEYCGGVSDLKKVLSNLEYAKTKFKDKIIEKNGYRVYNLGIHMTVTAKNFKNIKNIEDFCGDDIYFDCQGIADVGDAKKNEDYVGDEKLYYEYMKSSEQKYKPMVITKTEKGDDVCCLFYYGFAIGYEGEVMFDTHAVDTKFFGNIKNGNIEELKNQVRGEIKEYFDRYRTLYCPVRDSSFEKFTKYLEKKYKK